MSQHPIEGMLGVSMEKIREMVDVNIIIGEAITVADKTVIIPVSKVSFGFGSGGSDFPNKHSQEAFGGGAGAGVSIQPLAFLVVYEGDVQLLQMSTANSTAEKVMEGFPEMLEKLKGVFSKKKAKSEKDAKEEIN